MKIKFLCTTLLLLIMCEFVAGDEFFAEESPMPMGNSDGYSGQQRPRNDYPQRSRNGYQGRYDEDYNRNRQSFEDNRLRSRDKFESKHGAALDNQENQIASPQEFRLEQEKILEYKGRIKTLKDKMTSGNPTVEEMKLLIQFSEKLGKVYISRAIRLMKDQVKLKTYVDTSKEAVKESTNLITTAGTMLKQAEKDKKTRASTFQKADNKARKTNFQQQEQKELAKIEKIRSSDSVFKNFDKALGTAAKTASQSGGSPY